MIFYKAYYLIILLLFNCNSNHEKHSNLDSLSNSVFNEVLDQVLDSVSIQQDLKTKIFIPGRVENEEFLNIIKKDIVTLSKEDLTADLRRRLSNSIENEYHLNLNLKKYTVLRGNNTYNPSLSRSISLDSTSNKALLNLSPFIYEESKKLGIFYFSIKTHERFNNYIVYLFKKDGHWIIVKIFSLYS